LCPEPGAKPRTQDVQGVSKKLLETRDKKQ